MSPDPSTLAEGFSRLLALLDTDPDRAALAYGNVQKKLTKFFEWRGSRDAALHTDITLERVARRLGEGATVTTTNPYAFITGFAQNVWREHLRQPDRRFTALDEAQAIPAADSGDPLEAQTRRESDDRRFLCLDDCLGRLPDKQRRALLRYHEGQARTRIDARKRLADSFGIPVSALRLRMFRIREGLERCIVHCMGAEQAGAK